MGDRIPIDGEAREQLDAVLQDQKLTEWLDAHRRSRRSQLADFLLSQGTLQALLTSALIPFIGFLALVLYDQTPPRRAAAAAAQSESEARIAMSEVVGLMPLIIKDRESRQLARDILLARSKCANSASPRCAILAVLVNREQAANPTVAPSFGTSEGQAPPPPTNATPAEKTLAADPLAAPRIAYIQVYDDGKQSADAAKIAEALKRSGVAVPGIENVMRTHPETAGRSPQRGFIGVRFFDPGTKSAALYAANLIRDTLGVEASAQDLSSRGLNVQPGLVEIWFPKQR